MRLKYANYQIDWYKVTPKISYGYARNLDNYAVPWFFASSSPERVILRICTAIDRGLI